MELQMNMQAPFGGRKQSGHGREFGEYVSTLSNFSVVERKGLLITSLHRRYEHIPNPRRFLYSK